MNISDLAFCKKKEDTDDEICELIEKACKVLIDNKNFPARVCFDIPNSSYLAHIIITKDLIHEGEWRLQVGVMEDGYDKLFSCFLSHDTKEKLLEELNFEQTKDSVFDTIKQMYIRAEKDD